MKLKLKNRSEGFTLIELLTVLIIISMISATLLITLSSARSRSRDAKRKADLTQLQKALEFYYNDYGSYPSTGGSWYGVSANGGNKTTTGANAYIPGLTPLYLSELPVDPKLDTSGWSGYLYRSDGISYKILSHENGPESFPLSTEAFYDPLRPTWALMVCSSASPTACNTW